MATSSVEICNSALIKVGAERISALNESNVRARLCNEQYDKKRRNLLRQHPWNFAMDRATLAADVTDPEWGYTYRYPLASTILRVLQIEADEPYEIEGRYILTDAATVKIKYTKDITDTTLFDKNFEEALASDIAADIAFALTKNATLTKQLKDEARLRLREARSFDAQEGNPESTIEVDEWITSRF